MRWMCFLIAIAVLSCCSNPNNSLGADQAHVDSLANRQAAQRFGPAKMLQSAEKQIAQDMAILQISIRKNIAKDDPVAVAVSELPNEIEAQFSTKVPTVTVDTGSLRYYKNPIIYISTTLEKIITKQIDTSWKYYCYFQSFEVHEIVHLLQTTQPPKNYFTPKTDGDLPRYYSQPNEKEAYAVQSYYFLSHTDPEKITEILNLHVSMARKRELLINAMFKSIKPWRKSIFP